MSAPLVTVHRYTVHGRVQGVFFRDSTRRMAESLGLTGHAINLPDGSVEVLASGDTEALASLARWLQTGPPLASVSHVTDHGAYQGDFDTDRFRTG